MSTFLFILGRKPLLSLAEIISLWGEKSIKNFEDEMAVLDLDDEDPRVRDIEATLRKLGGTMKICKVYRVSDRIPPVAELIEQAYDATQSKFGSLKKVIYGVNAYSLSGGAKKNLSTFLKIFKKYLTEVGYASRYLNKFEGNIDSAFALTEDIIHKGVEFNFAQVEGKFYATYTVAAQDFRLYADRDYHKPYRDNQAGMLPPKLAQVMVNIGEGCIEKSSPKSPTPLLYDPFCGSGTVLMESLLCGMNAIGSDIRGETVEGARVNCAWTQKQFPETAHTTYETFTQDVTAMNLQAITAKYHPTVIVSESFLGPYFKNKPTIDEIKRVQTTLGDLYKKAVQKLGQLHIPVVLAIASHKHGGNYFFNEAIVGALKEMHLKQVPLLPNWITKRFTPEQALHAGYSLDRHTLIYDRDDQMVAREIFVVVPE